MGVLYELLTKVLAKRLKKVVEKVISKFYNAFIEGKQILDAVLVANELVDSMLKSNACGVMCKLDTKRSATMSIGVSYFQFLIGWILVRNGYDGLNDIYPLQSFM